MHSKQFNFAHGTCGAADPEACRHGTTAQVDSTALQRMYVLNYSAVLGHWPPARQVHPAPACLGFGQHLPAARAIWLGMRMTWGHARLPPKAQGCACLTGSAVWPLLHKGQAPAPAQQLGCCQCLMQNHTLGQPGPDLPRVITAEVTEDARSAAVHVPCTALPPFHACIQHVGCPGASGSLPGCSTTRIPAPLKGCTQVSHHLTLDTKHVGCSQP